MLVFSLVMAFLINPQLAAIFLCVTPFLAVGLFFIMRHAHPIFERVFKTYDRLNQVVQENLRGIRVVKSFVREEHEDEKFGKISENIYQDFSKAEKTVAFNMPLMQLCVYTVMLLIAWFGARMIVASGNNANVGMTTGELMSLISYAMQILMSLMMVSMVFVMLSISKASEERIAEVLEEVPDIQNPKNPVKEVKDGSIRFENVDFSYSGDPSASACAGLTSTSSPARWWASSAARARPNRRWCSSSPAFTTLRAAVCSSAAWMCAITTWKRCATPWPWCCKRTCSSPAPSRTTCAGATPTPPMKR